MDIIKPAVSATFDNFVTLADHQLNTSDVAETEFTAFDITDTYAAEDQRQVTSDSATVTMTIASPCVVTWTTNNLQENSVIRLTTTGALPTGLSVDTIYYAVNVTKDDFNLSLKPSGKLIATSGSQSGTHTAETTIHGVYEALKPTATSSSATSSGTTVTISGTITGQFVVGMILTGSGYAANTRILEILTGDGATSGDNLRTNISQTAGASIIGNAPYIDSTHWLRLRATNRWAMHDYATRRATTNLNAITNVYNFVESVDYVALLGLDAKTVRIKVIDNSGPTTLYDETSTTEAASAITGETERQDVLLVPNLPTSGVADFNIELTITGNSGETVECWKCIFGKKWTFGPTLAGAAMELRDFNTTSQDTFGNFTGIERGYSRELNGTVYVKKTDEDVFFNKMIELRARAYLFVGSNERKHTAVLGFLRDLREEIPYHHRSLWSLRISGVVE